MKSYEIDIYKVYEDKFNMVVSPDCFDITVEEVEKLIIKSLEDNIDYLSNYILCYDNDNDY